MEISDKKLEEILVTQGILTAEQIAQAVDKQKKDGGSLKKNAVALNLVTDETILSALLSHENIAHIRLKNYPIKPEVAHLLPREKCLFFKALPISLTRDLMTVAMVDPFNVVNLDDLHRLLGKEILPVYASEEDIRQAIDKQHPIDRMTMSDVMEQVETYTSDSPSAPVMVDVEEGSDDEKSPLVVMLANKIVEEAFHQGASDIHIEHQETKTVIRYRVDGNLREALVLPPKIKQALVARFKIMSELDISEKRLPQDGRIQYKKFTKNNIDLDLRVSTVPTAWGEKVVMRLLLKQQKKMTLEELGFLPDTLTAYRKLITKPWGMILHVGPTGSGKSMALYTALAEINRPDVNIQTAEDPIEYTLAGINQTQVHPDIGFTFARALRSFMRQDPDVILVGEIRDLETAKIATEAALTGHVLFSTLHTNDAPQTVTRLMEMGVEPFLLSATLLGVCAQRLARRLCRCKQKYEPSPEELRLLGIPPTPFLYKSRGCPSCKNIGYKGRMGLYELMPVTDEIKQAINARKPATEIKQIAVSQGMRTLQQDAVQKIIAGVTSIEEVVSVVRDD